MAEDATVRPNHHAGKGSVGGPAGYLVGLSLLVGRRGDARLACELASLRSGDALVDVGCGPGVAARVAAARGAVVVGVDPSPAMLRIARRLSGGHVEYREGVAEQLPLEDGGCSVVWSLATAHHWEDVARGLEEARRVLAPGGRLVVIERRVRDGATGHASHGWTEPQAASFAASCADAAFEEVRVRTEQAGRRALVAVCAVGRV